MLRIAICDDEKLFRENIKKYVLKYLSEKDISSEIDMFNSCLLYTSDAADE